ncbi:MAG: hypothetical protein M0Z87_05125 [Actinomycetota bacterium]|nr:hypothetical protein [Actinomycetota bacterium]
MRMPPAWCSGRGRMACNSPAVPVAVAVALPVAPADADTVAAVPKEARCLAAVIR